jgi:hypothetical protein
VSKSRNIKLILVAAAVFIALPIFAQAQVPGIRISNSVSHINPLDVGRLNLNSRQVMIAENNELSAGTSALVGFVNIGAVCGQVKYLGQAAPLGLSMTGRLENGSDMDVVVHFFIEPAGVGSEPEARNYLGSIFVPAGSETEMAPSDRFEQNLAEHLAYFASEGETSVGLYAKALTRKGTGAQVHLDRIALRVNPMFHTTYMVHNNPNGTSPLGAGLSSVSLSGTVSNRGSSPLRLVLVAGIQDVYGVEFSEGVILDGSVAAKDSADLNDMLADGAGERLREVMAEAAFGDQVEMHLFLFGENGMKVRAENLEIHSEITYR